MARCNDIPLLNVLQNIYDPKVREKKNECSMPGMPWYVYMYANSIYLTKLLYIDIHHVLIYNSRNHHGIIYVEYNS